MYIVNIKISHKEGAKPVNETYIVNAISLTDTDIMLSKEFKYFSVNSAKASNYVKVFETGDGSFFRIKLAIEDLDGKLLKEEFIQEAPDNDAARSLFGKNIDYGTILDVVSTNIMGVIR